MFLAIYNQGSEHYGDPRTLNPNSVYAGINSVDVVKKLDDGSIELRLWVEEPVKTANVPGFCENEKLVIFKGEAFLMSDRGSTIATYSSRFVKS